MGVDPPAKGRIDFLFSVQIGRAEALCVVHPTDFLFHNRPLRFFLPFRLEAEEMGQEVARFVQTHSLLRVPGVPVLFAEVRKRKEIFFFRDGMEEEILTLDKHRGMLFALFRIIDEMQADLLRQSFADQFIERHLFQRI